ncbi:MAG TPA: FliH/SctL family protein [bacterium]|nr:FliH/SctL family protein [bacterium]
MAKILKGEDFKKRLNLQDRIESDLSSAFSGGPEIGGVIDREILDASDQAKIIISEAKAAAEKIKAEAKEVLGQVQEEMEKARQQGFEQGQQEGLQQGLEMLQRVKELRQKLFDDNEREMVKLIFEIAEKIIGREFRENDKAIMNVIRLAVSDAVGEKIIVHVNPKDYEKVKKNEEELLQKVESGKTLVFREDDTVKVGGCVVETDIGTIDAQLDTQLNAIKKALAL